MAATPSSLTWAPSKRSSMKWKRSSLSVNRCGAQHALVMKPPYTFGRNLQLSFDFSPHARAGPRAAALGDEGVCLPSGLFSAQHAVVLLPDPRHAACIAAISPSTSKL
jgi:hypothetical protein